MWLPGDPAPLARLQDRRPVRSRRSAPRSGSGVRSVLRESSTAQEAIVEPDERRESEPNFDDVVGQLAVERWEPYAHLGTACGG